MQKRTTFESLQFEHETKILNALHNLYMARTREEVEQANMQVHKVVGKYSSQIKKFLDESALLLISDQAKMQDLLNDLMASYRYELTYEQNRNTVKWTVETPYKSKYWYISKLGTPVDLENFKSWVYSILIQ